MVEGGPIVEGATMAERTNHEVGDHNGGVGHHGLHLGTPTAGPEVGPPPPADLPPVGHGAPVVEERLQHDHVQGSRKWVEWVENISDKLSSIGQFGYGEYAESV